MSIYTKIKLWAEKKEREDWLDKYHCDQKCPKCNTWQGNCGGWKSRRDGPTPMNDVTTCGKCGQETTWFDFGMGFTLADEITGNPLNKEV